MPLDPKATFPINVITRASICDIANDQLDEPMLAPDSDLLTDEVCSKYASILREANVQFEESGDAEQFRQTVVKSWGTLLELIGFDWDAKEVKWVIKTS